MENCSKQGTLHHSGNGDMVPLQDKNQGNFFLQEPAATAPPGKGSETHLTELGETLH